MRGGGHAWFGHIIVEMYFKTVEIYFDVVDILISARHVMGMNDVIDTRGLMCPLPVLRVGKVLRGLDAGTVTTVWADDPIAVVDIPHFCVEAGHRLISQSDTGDYQVYIIVAGQKNAASD